MCVCVCVLCVAAIVREVTEGVYVGMLEPRCGCGPNILWLAYPASSPQSWVSSRFPPYLWHVWDARPVSSDLGSSAIVVLGLLGGSWAEHPLGDRLR